MILYHLKICIWWNWIYSI